MPIQRLRRRMTRGSTSRVRDYRRVDQPGLEQGVSEGVVLLAAGYQLGDDTVVWVECVSASGLRAL